MNKSLRRALQKGVFLSNDIFYLHRQHGFTSSEAETYIHVQLVIDEGVSLQHPLDGLRYLGCR